MPRDRPCTGTLRNDEIGPSPSSQSTCCNGLNLHLQIIVYIRSSPALYQHLCTYCNRVVLRSSYHSSLSTPKSLPHLLNKNTKIAAQHTTCTLSPHNRSLWPALVPLSLSKITIHHSMLTLPLQRLYSLPPPNVGGTRHTSLGAGTLMNSIPTLSS